MKSVNFKKYLFFAVLQIFVITLTFADNEKFTKKFKREYVVNKGTQLQIDNKYGNIDIKNWDKDLISVEVIITVKTSGEDKARKLLNQIKIEFVESGDVIFVKTVFDESLGKLFQGSGDRLIDIYYSVYMPKDVPLNLVNKYGNVFINELVSISNIDIKYGNLKANKILYKDEKPLTQITLAYSNANIQECVWVKFDVKYSNIEVQESRALVILSRYSKIFITRGTSIVTESKYDTYRLGRLNNLVVTAAYSNFKAEEISNKIATETKYTDLYVDYIPAGFESINVNTSYGTYSMAIDPDASYLLDGNARYAKISYHDSGTVNRFNENNVMKVNGRVGNNPNTKSSVTISSNYGGVRLLK